jgi:hypothetical protein
VCNFKAIIVTGGFADFAVRVMSPQSASGITHFDDPRDHPGSTAVDANTHPPLAECNTATFGSGFRSMS